MAKATTEAYTEPNELQNQQANTQNQVPNIPLPREALATSNSDLSEQLVFLFEKDIDEHHIAAAAAYLDQQAKAKDASKNGAFLISLLEKLGTLPCEISAEEHYKRQQGVQQIEQLMLDLESFTTQDFGFNGTLFRDQITDPIGSSEIGLYPVVQLLRESIRKYRSSGNRQAEAQAMTAQRLVLIGIAKQRGMYSQ